MTSLLLEPDAYSPVAIEIYRSLGPVYLGDTPKPDTIRLLVVRLAYQIDGRMLSRFPALEAVVTPTTGLNHIDEAACADAGVAVYSLRSTPEALERVTSTSELTLGLILALVRRIPQAHCDVVDRGSWQRDRFKGRQIAGLKLGLVGLGRIGRQVASYARALGMEVLASDPFWPDTGFDLAAPRSLHALLTESDIVSLHAKYNVGAAHLIGHNEIAVMAPGALLINTARGELLDEAAAVAALETEHLGGLAVDVISNELVMARDLSQSPIIAAARAGLNVIITPHIGGCSQDAMHVTEEIMARYSVKQMRLRKYDEERDC